MTIDEQIQDIVKTARIHRGKIELIVEGDLNDADYAYTINEYEPDTFLEYEIDKVYKFYKAMADDYNEAMHRWSAGQDWNMLHTIEKEHQKTLENILCKDKISARYATLWPKILYDQSFIPNGTSCEEEVRIITDVKLKVVIKEI